MEPGYFDRFFRGCRLPTEVDLAELRREWLALGPPYEIDDRHLPLPVWARRPFEEGGEAAWQALRRDVPALDAGRAFCIYFHIPFCAERCAFCDCYSFRLASHRALHVEQYVTRLGQEMALWGGLAGLPARPVSTVHLGGGTPTYLGEAALARLVAACQTQFNTGRETEWALESTASELGQGMLDHLHDLGFRRLHVGVQSLQAEARQALNRRASGSAVLEALAGAVSRGWVVSVDLIYGLPGQTLDGLLADIRALIGAGVDGFSLYELQLSARNRPFARQHGLEGRDRRRNYLLGQVAGSYLAALGYTKTLFNHFAGVHDTNLYFTFPERGEDLLALGAVADGVFDDYHYRHPQYAAYCRGVDGGSPGLEGGLRRTAEESRLQPLVTALMAGRVPLALFDELGAGRLLADWLEARLLAPGPRGDLRLTGSGSWFVGNMISRLVDGQGVGGGA